MAKALLKKGDDESVVTKYYPISLLPVELCDHDCKHDHDCLSGGNNSAHFMFPGKGLSMIVIWIAQSIKGNLVQKPWGWEVEWKTVEVNDRSAVPKPISIHTQNVDKG